MVVRGPWLAALTAAILVVLPGSAEAGRLHSHRHHRPIEELPLEAPPPSLQDRAAYRSGYAFGLLDLGISGTPTAISPYAGYGYVGPGYDGPGFGHPGY